MIELNKLPTVILGYGTAAVLKIDLTDADMTRGNIVLSIRNKGGTKVIASKTFTTAAEHTYVFDDDFVKANPSPAGYEYDLIQLVSGEKYQLTEIGYIKVVDTVGGHG